MDSKDDYAVYVLNARVACEEALQDFIAIEKLKQIALTGARIAATTALVYFVTKNAMKH